MKIALITGASAGIGQATAIEIARQGIGVITTYRSHHAEVLADGGAIVNTGSTSALTNRISAGYSAYAALKGAMHTVTPSGERL
jgi:NAD(P)-dependent dehydrogenase (short-subunit alcohol dehydrogenase family)